MAYPSDSDIATWSSANAANPETVYAFVADTSYGRLPQSPTELTNWWSATISDPRFAGITDQNLIAAYFINNRGFPPSPTVAIAWLQGLGYYANGQPTGQEPQVGQGYDQAVGITNTAPTATNPVTGAAPTGATPPDFFSSLTTTVTDHPVVAGVVGLAALFGLYKLTGRRR